MIIPVRCFSCGKVVGMYCFPPLLGAISRKIQTDSATSTGDLWERYLKLIDEGVADGTAMDRLGLHVGCTCLYTFIID